MKELLDQGAVRDQTRLAEVMGVTRMRVSQLLDLTVLAPDIQEEILFARMMAGAIPLRSET
jgi:predicted XRE-type DNA-binding protein